MTIKSKNISFKYGIKPILEDISVQMEKGHLYGILGPNGSGKTTFLNILSGTIKQNNGSVFIDDFNINKFSHREMAKRLSVVKQSVNLDFNFTVKEIVLMGRYAHIGRFSQETSKDKSIIDEILKNFNLWDLKERIFNELSGGEQQKVIIARAIAQQSKILLLDEPTNHLDINFQIEFMKMFKNYVNNGLIVVVVLHDLNLAAQFCDKIILLNQGKINAFGEVEQIITKENIKKVYNTDIIVRKNIYNNSIYVTPILTSFNSRPKNNNEKKRRIHVIAGGGAGTEILPKINNFDVSVGVINVLDDDYEMANELKYHILSEAPFSQISDQSVKKLRQIISEVDVIILTNIPFGMANLRNLEVLEQCREKIIIFERDPIENRDFTNGKATIIYKNLKKKENVSVINKMQDLIKLIETWEETNQIET